MFITDEYTNTECATVVLTVKELKTFAADVANQADNQKIAIVCGVDSIGGEYVGFHRVND